MSNKVFIVGAGPGDPDLITVKGLNAIKKADVILFDALSSPALLAHAKGNCKLIYVGKRKGKVECSQDEINRLLVFYARDYSCIVRLKGGDPFVFGRGHEELEYALKHGVDVELIPGISSALSGPASVGIPLTKRGVNESFWVITGTLSDGSLSNDLYHAAQSSATIVVLMGMSQLEKIVTLFKQMRTEHEPVAIIQHATLPQQRSVTGTLQDIAAQVADHNIQSPAVIVIGNVVKERLLTEQFADAFTETLLKIAV